MNTDIQESVNLALGEIEEAHPSATVEGLRAVSSHVQPGLAVLFNNVGFNQEVQRCIDWLNDKGLQGCKTTSFNPYCPSSYGFKHIVERHYKKRGVYGCYIRNMAFIVAMHIAGYRYTSTGMNAQFNISKQALKRCGFTPEDMMR